jgi:anti-sigma B factor antagonist
VLQVEVTGSSAARTEMAVRGVLDTNGSRKLLTKLDRLIDDGRHHLVLDVSGVTFCDSTGVSALVRSHARAAQMAGELRLVAPSPALRRVLEISGLTRMFGC